MKKCVYIFNGDTYSYEQLVDKLLEQGLKDSDILYSIADGTRQEQLVERTEKFIRENKARSLHYISPEDDYSFGGDPSEHESSNFKHILNFLDDPIFEEAAGALKLPRMDEESFIKNKANIIKSENDQLSGEEAIELAKKELSFYKLQRYDGFILHYLLRNVANEPTIASIKDNLNKLAKEFKDDQDMIDRINQILNSDKLINDILQSQTQFLLAPINFKKNSKIFRNIPISAVLHTERGDVEIFDQIDALVIDASGAVQIYKYKITEEDTTHWGNRGRVQTPKTEKYRFELAFIQALLENSGILRSRDKTNISLNLITLQTKYDHNAQDGLPLTTISNQPRVIEMSMHNGQPQLSKHIQIARQIIQPAISLTNCDEAIIKANQHLNRIWVGSNIQVEAVQQSVADWISQNKNKAIRVLHPLPSSENKAYYDVIYNGKHHYITEDTDIEHNKEIEQVVSELLSQSAERSGTIADRIQSGIVQAFENGSKGLDAQHLSGFSMSQIATLKSILDPYFSQIPTKDGPMYEWEFQKNSEISNYNILLFKHNKTGQLDIITLSDLNLDSVVRFKKGTTLAGCYSNDVNVNQLPSTWGNIQAMRTLVLLNYIMPDLSNCKLGRLKVVSTFDTGSGKTFSIQNLIGKYYHPLMQLVESNTPNEGKFENNFKGVSYINVYDTLIQTFKDIIARGSAKYIDNFEEKVNDLEKAVEEAGLSCDSVKIDRLLELAKDISEQYSSKSAEYLANRLEIEKEISPDHPLKMLLMIQETLSYLRQQDIEPPTRIPKITRAVLKSGAIPSNNFKVVKDFWLQTSQRINDEAYLEGKQIDKLIAEYYKEVGYTNAQNKFLGNQTHVFNDLFEDNDQMRFYNPYEENNSLTNAQRKFLKQALYIFAKYRYMNNGRTFQFKQIDVDSEDYKKFVDENAIWYFNCPLKKASNKSLDRMEYNFIRTRDSIKRLIDDPKLWAREFFTDEQLALYTDKNQTPDDITKLSVRNYFWYGEVSLNGESFDSGTRDGQLTSHPNVDYFEHNVENLLRDFSFESIRSQNMSKMMVASKLFLLQMHLTGNQNNNIDDFKDEFKYINDYLKLNVFDLSVMDNSERKIAKIILPLRNVFRHTLVAGNVASAVRDCTEGFAQIMARSLIKNNTNIKPNEVLRAYGIVVKDSVEDSLRGLTVAGIVNQLCVKYRLSNIDVANVSEGQKTGGHGINNFIDEMYWSIRKPDFLNRMVLFVSQCIHDGVWEAFSLNEDGELIYDWKKDKRFSLLASNDKSNLEEYNKQKSLYFSLLRVWNQDHPSNLAEKGNLPMPYSNLDIQAIRHLSDNIWGAYDKSEKAMGEYALLGQTFAMFTTWMNGQLEMYFKPLQTQKDQFKWTQEIDLDGNLLFIDKDGNITTEDTGVPSLVQMPIQVQGIFQTLKQTLAILTNLEEGNFKEDIWGNEMNQNNIKKLLTDITMTILLWTVIKVALDSLRDKQKENTDPNDVVTNALCEVLYRGFYSAWDGFQGPLNAINYLGNNTNPPIYTESISITKDLIKVLSGDYTLLSFGSRHFAPVRPFRETIKAAQSGKQPS